MQRTSSLWAAIISLALLAGCSGSSAALSAPATATTRPAAPTPTATLARPASYAPLRIVTKALGSPDDLALDPQGRIVFADMGNMGVNRIEVNGTITTLVSGLPDPEGVLVLPDGTIFVSVQGQGANKTDAILRIPPGGTPQTFATFTNRTASVGLDSISRDPRTGDILAADSPNGVVYRISADGKQQTILARGFTRPVDAIVAPDGGVIVADEYGGKVAMIAPDGQVTTLARLSYPDDLAFDLDGTLLVTTLTDNTLRRLNPTTGATLAILATNLHEPQGLAVDAAGNIFLSEETGNAIVELQRQ